MRIKIAGELHSVSDVKFYGDLPTIVLDDGSEWYLAKDSEQAGEAAREYWEDLAQNDPTEFACMVGEQTLVQWSLGQSAGPGYTKVNSLTEWLDLWENVPEEHWATYDGFEQPVTRVGILAQELDFIPTVAYRAN